MIPEQKKRPFLGGRPPSERRIKPALLPAAPLPPPLPPNRRLTLTLTLRTGLLVKAPLPEFGIESGALHLSLEAAKRPLEAFVVLY